MLVWLPPNFCDVTGLDTSVEEEAGLLHYACLFRRLDVITYLTSIGIPAKLKDKHGKTLIIHLLTFCFNQVENFKI